MEGSEPKHGPGATALALVWLGRKPLTTFELRQRLSRRGHTAAEIEEALTVLCRQGHLDDRRLALHYLLTRSDRLGHGPSRLTRELAERGVPSEVIRDAWDEALRDHGVDPAGLLERALRRRLPAGSIDRGLARRVYNAMLRAGFEAHAVRQALVARLHGEAGELDEADSEP